MQNAASTDRGRNVLDAMTADNSAQRENLPIQQLEELRGSVPTNGDE